MTKLLPLWQQYAIFVPIATCGLLFLQWVRRENTLLLTQFRDKSALYGRELKPGEPPSWP